MTAEALTLELRALRVEVAALRAAVDRMAPPALDPRSAELLRALAAVFGSGTTFASAEVLSVAAVPLGDRPRLQAALKAIGASDSHRVGMAFASIAKRTRGQALRLSRAGEDNGSNLWAVESGASGA